VLNELDIRKSAVALEIGQL